MKGTYWKRGAHPNRAVVRDDLTPEFELDTVPVGQLWRIRIGLGGVSGFIHLTEREMVELERRVHRALCQTLREPPDHRMCKCPLLEGRLLEGRTNG